MRVARLFGIDIYVDVSWLFIFALVAWSLSADMGPLHPANLPPAERIALGVGTALLFFASVLVHELAHSVLARARGLEVSRITLFIFGGVSALGSEFDSASGEGWIALVGPLASIAIALAFFVLAQLLGVQTSLGIAAAYLAYANTILGIFNLLPAYPLDGGKVLHSLIWRKTGSRLRATRIAAGIGRSIAILLIAFGLLETFVIGLLGGLWMALIGWFLFQAGSAEAYQTELASSLRGRNALDVATAPPPALPADTPVQTALELLLKTGQRATAVADGARLLGIVTLTDLARSNAQAPLSAVMTPMTKVKSAAPETDALDTLKLLAETGFHQIPVVDGTGALRGFVTREGLLQRVALAQGA
jgi:Zn-dependent protease/CBS domain-containing protein